MALFTKEESLAYHEEPRPGKLEVLPVKPCFTQKDLSMAYSPGVANACLAIADDPSLANAYTGRGNLVGRVDKLRKLGADARKRLPEDRFEAEGEAPDSADQALPAPSDDE